MTEVVITKKPGHLELEAFFGVPVLVQLHVPIVIVQVVEKQALPYTDKPEEKQWIPQETQDPQGNFVSVQMMRYAVLRRLASATHVEMIYTAPGPVKGTLAQFSTMVEEKNIAYVTRIVHVPDGAPTIILAS